MNASLNREAANILEPFHTIWKKSVNLWRGDTEGESFAIFLETSCDWWPDLLDKTGELLAPVLRTAPWPVYSPEDIAATLDPMTANVREWDRLPEPTLSEFTQEFLERLADKPTEVQLVGRIQLSGMAEKPEGYRITIPESARHGFRTVEGEWESLSQYSPYDESLLFIDGPQDPPDHSRDPWSGTLVIRIRGRVSKQRTTLSTIDSVCRPILDVVDKCSADENERRWDSNGSSIYRRVIWLCGEAFKVPRHSPRSIRERVTNAIRAGIWRMSDCATLTDHPNQRIVFQQYIGLYDVLIDGVAFPKGHMYTGKGKAAAIGTRLDLSEHCQMELIRLFRKRNVCEHELACVVGPNDFETARRLALSALRHLVTWCVDDPQTDEDGVLAQVRQATETSLDRDWVSEVF